MGNNDGTATTIGSGGIPFDVNSQILNFSLTCAGAFTIQYRILGASSWSSIPGNNTPLNPYTLTGLASNTTYKWRVKSTGTPW